MSRWFGLVHLPKFSHVQYLLCISCCGYNNENLWNLFWEQNCVICNISSHNKLPLYDNIMYNNIYNDNINWNYLMTMKVISSPHNVYIHLKCNEILGRIFFRGVGGICPLLGTVCPLGNQGHTGIDKYYKSKITHYEITTYIP